MPHVQDQLGVEVDVHVHHLDLPDFLLDFAGKVFALAFGRQVRVAGYLSRFLFNLTLDFMKCALHLIGRARFHLVSPCLGVGRSYATSTGRTTRCMWRSSLHGQSNVVELTPVALQSITRLTICE